MKYAKAECPVESYDKEWLEKTLLWFEQKLGKDYIRNKEYLIPAYCKFQYHDFNTQEAIEYFMGYICNFIDLNASLVNFELVWDNNNDLDDFAEDIADPELEKENPVTPNTKEAPKYTIAIFTEQLVNFDHTFNSVAHQLVCIKLLHQSVFNFTNTYMTDFAMLLSGFGILMANNFVRTKQWGGVNYSAWDVRTQGTFNHRMYGYLLALLNDYRGEKDDQALEQFLCPDAKAFYVQSKKYLANENGYMDTLRGRIIEDDEVFIQKQFYENGSIRIISHIVKGKYEGVMIFFHLNGELWSERLYRNNVSYTVFSNFNKYGEPVEKGTLFEGNGTLYIYNPDGNLNTIEEYLNGNKIK